MEWGEGGGGGVVRCCAKMLYYFLKMLCYFLGMLYFICYDMLPNVTHYIINFVEELFPL